MSEAPEAGQAAAPVRPLLTREEAAEYLTISPHHVYRLTARGELISTKIGGAVRYSQDDLDEYIERQRAEGRQRAREARG